MTGLLPPNATAEERAMDAATASPRRGSRARGRCLEPANLPGKRFAVPGLGVLGRRLGRDLAGRDQASGDRGVHSRASDQAAPKARLPTLTRLLP